MASETVQISDYQKKLQDIANKKATGMNGMFNSSNITTNGAKIFQDNSNWKTWENANTKASVEEEPTTSGYDYTGLITALQKINQDKYSSLKQALLSNKQRSDDLANANYARNLREWKKTYGNGISGQGLSNKFGLMAQRDSTIQDNQNDYLNNLSTINSNKYDDYSTLVGKLNSVDSDSLKKILSLI